MVSWNQEKGIRDKQTTDKEVREMVAANCNTEGASGEHKGIKLLLGPIVGLAYVIALPFIAIGTIALMVVGKAIEGVEKAIGSVMHFEWRPGEAYLGGKKKREAKRKRE